jgi:hypothetical protein
MQSGVFAQAGGPPSRIPFLNWLNYQAAYTAAATATADGAAAAADGPAAKCRRVGEVSPHKEQQQRHR